MLSECFFVGQKLLKVNLMERSKKLIHMPLLTNQIKLIRHNLMCRFSSEQLQTVAGDVLRSNFSCKITDLRKATELKTVIPCIVTTGQK